MNDFRSLYKHTERENMLSPILCKDKVYMYTKSPGLIDAVDGSVFQILHDVRLNVFELYIYSLLSVYSFGYRLEKTQVFVNSITISGLYATSIMGSYKRQINWTPPPPALRTLYHRFSSRSALSSLLFFIRS